METTQRSESRCITNAPLTYAFAHRAREGNQPMPPCYYCGYEFDESDKPDLVGRAECPSCGASNPMNAHDTGR